MRRILLPVLVCLGCTASPHVDPSLTTGLDQINGRTFTIRDAVWIYDLGHGFSFNGPALYIDTTDRTGACSDSDAGVEPSAAQDLLLGLATTDSSGKASPASKPGEYTIVSASNAPPASSNVAEVFYENGCGSDTPFQGVSGVVTVTGITGDAVDGSFDAYLTCKGFDGCPSTAQTHLAASFHSLPCSAFDVNRTATCSDGGV